MNKRLWIGIAGMGVLIAGLSWFSFSTNTPGEPSPETGSEVVSTPEQPAQQPTQGDELSPSSGRMGGNSAFAGLSRGQRAAFLTLLSQQSAADVFQAWVSAGRSENDLFKQSSIGAVLAAKAREQPLSQELADEMLGFILKSENTHQERADLIGVLGYAATPETIELLLHVHDAQTDSALIPAIISAIEQTGASWGDGNRHLERSPPLERAWRESKDPRLLKSLAVAIARIGGAQGAQQLFEDAFATEANDELRRDTARRAITKIYSPTVVPGISAFLAKQTGDNDRSRVAGDLLVKIGNAEAGRALVDWLRTKDVSVQELARAWVRSSRKAELLKQWNAALDPTVPFRDERIRSAIEEALASQ